jgi:hypothetical protein
MPWESELMMPMAASSISRSSQDSLSRSVCIATWISWVSATVQGAVDDGGIPSVVLVDLQAAGAGLSLAGERGGREARRVGADPEVRRPGGEGHEHPLEIEGGVVVETAGDEGGHPGGQRHGHEARLDEVHVGVNPAGVAMYACP